MPKTLLFIIILTVIITTGATTLLFFSNRQQVTPKSEIETAINQAKHLYRLEKERGRDLSLGPCLSNALMPNWVVDIVHKPRLPVDDLPENQCSAYIEGRVKHFVELDLEGDLVKAR